MFAIAILAPGLILGAIAWGVVGFLRQRGREEFTLATAASFYAQILMAAGLLLALAGIGLLIKLGLSLIDPAYSYFIPSEPPGTYNGPSIPNQQTQDLILASMLVGVGLLVGFGHRMLSRFVGRLPGGSPSWIVGGTVVALTVLTGLAGFLSTIVGGYQALTYFIVGGPQVTAFGDAAGAALVFIPAWAVAMAMMLRRLRPARAQPPVARPVAT